MTDWTNSDWPGWGDGGKKVEIKLADGSIISGTLLVDAYFDGEDECPVFEIEKPDGTVVSFADNDFWRFV